ncbi:MAG: type II toxin-antitoxin system RelB family antitoxin [Terracidiphilus sp.]
MPREAAAARIAGHFDGDAACEYNEYVEYIDSQEMPMATSVRLDPAVEQRLDRLAERTGRTKAFYLREIIEGGLDDLEDYYLASATMEHVRKGKERVHSAKDVRKDLGLDN